MGIPKQIYSLQTQVRRNPSIIRALVKKTGLDPYEVREKIASLRSRKDLFFQTLKEVVQES